MMKDILQENLPFFPELDAADQDSLAYLSYTQHFSRNEVVLVPSDPCENLLILLSGRVKSLLVQARSSLLLYYLNQGDICTLASSPRLFGMSQKITLVSDSESEILKVPATLYSQLCSKYPDMTLYLRRNFMDRFSDILFILQQKAFSSPRQLVASYLYDLSVNCPDSVINVTQETISRETSVARSLVSNILAQFELEGILKASHGKIKIYNSVKLQSI